MTTINSTVLFTEAVADSKYQGKKDGFSGKVNAFGHEWVVARLNFARSALEGVIDAVYHAALTLFRFVLSAGTLFLNKNLRDQTSGAFNAFGTNLETVGKSVVGVVCPYLAKRLDEKIHNKSPQPVVQQVVPTVKKEEIVVVIPAVATA